MSNIDAALILLEREYGKLTKAVKKAEEEINSTTTCKVMTQKLIEISTAIDILRNHEDEE